MCVQWNPTGDLVAFTRIDLRAKGAVTSEVCTTFFQTERTNTFFSMLLHS
jgi:hypothetical protein